MESFFLTLRNEQSENQNLDVKIAPQALMMKSKRAVMLYHHVYDYFR